MPSTVITSTLNPESLRRGMTLYDDMVSWAPDAPVHDKINAVRKSRFPPPHSPAWDEPDKGADPWADPYPSADGAEPLTHNR
jgi:hypothetical protein